MIFVSSIAKGNHSTQEEITQSKINAALKGLEDVIDSFKEEKTKQSFHLLDYNGSFRSTIKADKPQRDVPISGYIGNKYVYVGKLKTNGILDASVTLLIGSEHKNIETIESVQTINDESSGNVEETTHDETIYNRPYKVSYTENDVKIEKSGTEEEVKQYLVNSTRYDDDTNQWYWSGYIVIKNTLDYDEKKDYSKAKLMIHQYYQ